jgi:hypothetical protein
MRAALNTGSVHDRVNVNSLRFSRLPDALESALRYFDAEVALADEVSGGSVATLVLTHLDGPRTANISAGFEQWCDSVVWWARMGEATQEFQAV